ncbi:hypothetical protein V6N13_138508 [Hibiscus sabdariffa]
MTCTMEKDVDRCLGAKSEKIQANHSGEEEEINANARTPQSVQPMPAPLQSKIWIQFDEFPTLLIHGLLHYLLGLQRKR